MGFIGKGIYPVAWVRAKQVESQCRHAVKHQHAILKNILETASNTSFGTEHSFKKIKNHKDFIKNVPIRDYEESKLYIDRIVSGELHVMWPGKPKYLAKTSGTTSGAKYIPISHDSVSNHINAATNALFSYLKNKQSSYSIEGKMLFLSGSPDLETGYRIPTGRLSGIINHEVPAWANYNKLPSFAINRIQPWETKVKAIAEESIKTDLRIVSGIPPWVIMYFESLLELSGKQTIKEIFPNLSCFMYGGVNYEPYRKKINDLIGEQIDLVETFPASEGFFAYQNTLEPLGMLLNTNDGIFYEFVPLSEMGNSNPTRLQLSEVSLKTDYVLIVSSNAGLWAYNTGDLVQFTSLHPYRVIVSGRAKHFLSAFGEHVIAQEVEKAMSATVAQFGIHLVEFTVAPQVNPPEGGLPYHEWFVEFEKVPDNLEEISNFLNAQMLKLNIYYKDLIDGSVLRPLKITCVAPSGFRDYQRKSGKLGEQFKVVHLANDRKIVELLEH